MPALNRRTVLQLGGLAAAAALFADLSRPPHAVAATRPLAVGVPEIEALRLRLSLIHI